MRATPCIDHSDNHVERQNSLTILNPGPWCGLRGDIALTHLHCSEHM